MSPVIPTMECKYQLVVSERYLLNELSQTFKGRTRQDNSLNLEENQMVFGQ